MSRFCCWIWIVILCINFIISENRWTIRLKISNTFSSWKLLEHFQENWKRKQQTIILPLTVPSTKQSVEMWFNTSICGVYFPYYFGKTIPHWLSQFHSLSVLNNKSHPPHLSSMNFAFINSIWSYLYRHYDRLLHFARATAHTMLCSLVNQARYSTYSLQCPIFLSSHSHFLSLLFSIPWIAQWKLGHRRLCVSVCAFMNMFISDRVLFGRKPYSLSVFW